MATRAALILAGVVLLAVAVATLPLRDDEPRYKGRPLSHWTWVNYQNPNDPEAREAIVAITTNSAPVLIRWLSRDTTTEQRLEAKLPAFLRMNTIISRFMNRERYRAACSSRALRISGTNATCAIPELAELLAHHNSPIVQMQAILVLCSIGPAALPSFRQAITNRNAQVRQMAVFGLGKLGTNAAPALPDLIAAQSDPDHNVRREATNAIEEIAPGALTNSPAQ